MKYDFYKEKDGNESVQYVMSGVDNKDALIKVLEEISDAEDPAICNLKFPKEGVATFYTHEEYDSIAEKLSQKIPSAIVYFICWECMRDFLVYENGRCIPEYDLGGVIRMFVIRDELYEEFFDMPRHDTFSTEVNVTDKKKWIYF